MRHGVCVRRGLLILAGSLVLLLVGISDAVCDELDALRSNYESTLKTNEKRIQEIEARERGMADPQARAEKITQDKVAALRNSLKGDRTGKALADKAANDPSAMTDLLRESSTYLDAALSDWGVEGSERKRLQEAMAAAQKNIESINANLTRAAGATATLPAVDALGKAARIETAVNEAADRLQARWQREQAAREREAKQREREAAERARGSGTK